MSRPVTTVRPGRGGRLLVLSAVTMIGGIGVFFVIAAGANLVHKPGSAALMLLAAVPFLAAAEVLRRLAQRPLPALTMVIGPDEIVFQRHGQVADHVGRSEVGVVLLDDLGRAGLAGVAVYGPTGTLVGQWPTEWVGQSSWRTWRALKRHSWPRVLTLQHKPKWVSRDAPEWARSVV